MRPGLLVVDLSLGFTERASPLACDAEDAVRASAQLLDRARAAGAPVLFTTVAYGEDDLATAATFMEKVPGLRALRLGDRLTEIDPRLAPAPGEPVLRKLFASAFFGTGLAARLRAADVDTLLVTGASTSGCVRASAVDALQHGFRPLVVRDAVADRDAAAHIQSLRDLDAKYADVIALERALEILDPRRHYTGHHEER
ncbi:isochorismatase family protein [Conexibacter woesei]|uniref:Isochorismatase hydrolase n=1 Tax=Conexibacter woesei (strain DSM 14684 / CCUG 47730 / CIP 108061 / JCM 11494 / NBRC 100937 / ID131577) TaxID=469383 RepID=D3F3M3_CONWI|nr:isochorismatase family protein [Conexibacter woesei]ADB52388.1 isochorismatase hydrolase [Conexibacter woesei DSM 14684]